MPGALALLSPLAQLIYIPVSVVLGASLGLSGTQIGLTVGVHSLATAGANLALGPLLDVVPVRRILPAALVANLLISLVLWWHQSYELLIIGRIGTGIAGSAILLSAYVLIADASGGSEGERDRGFSAVQTFQSVGAAAGLGIGAVFAGIGRPADAFAFLAVYAIVVTLISLHWLPKGVSGVVAARPSPRETLRGIARLASNERVLWLMAGSVALGMVIQGSHFGVSTLLAAGDASLPVRVITSMLIPLGVFSGSTLNRRLLRSRSRGQLYPRVYSALAVAAGLYALSSALGAGPALTAGSLWLLGALLGSTMPLGVALTVGWHPEVRGTATSAEALARQVGATIGPITVGAVVSATSLTIAATTIAAIACVGVVAAWIALRGRAGGIEAST